VSDGDGSPSRSAGKAYAELRRRVTELLAAEDRDLATAAVAACPAWRVKDVVAHLSGVVDDVLGGRVDGAGSDPWTAAQVAARADRPLPEVLDEWNAAAPALEAVLDTFGTAGHQLVMDAATHEQDLRAALGAPGGRESDAVVIGLDWLASTYQAGSGAARGPGLSMVAKDGARSTWAPADDRDVVATVTGSSFDLLRSFSGRRTAEEVRSRLTWSGDVDAILPTMTFGPFRAPAAPLGE
jgi:uncharacterized protein (TIGR03083 family)